MLPERATHGEEQVADPCSAVENASEHDERMVDLLDKYVEQLESGDPISLEDFAQFHAEDDAHFRKELVNCLRSVTLIHAAVESARDRDERVSGQSRLTAAFNESPFDTTPSESDPADTPPRVVGDYRLLREIGRGGMGVVYEAEEQSLRRRVALKVLPFAAVLDQRQITRFRNEAQSAAGLHHPHIVPVFAIGQERGVHYYAMQHIEGRSLSQAINGLRSDANLPASPDATTETAQLVSQGDRESVSIPSAASAATTATTPRESYASLGATNRSASFFRSAARLAADAADALQHAHELGVVHRDIKPSNLLIDEQGKVWVADFGLARMQTDLGVTATGDIVGTLRYMSPEQARGRADQIDGRTDVYALGATLYELLTLQHAQPGNDRRKLLDNLERAEPVVPRRLNPAVPADLENIVLRAMEKDRDGRYASAADFRDDLQRFLDGKPTVARPATLAERAAKWTKRHQRLVGVATSALAAIALIAIVSVVLINQARWTAEAALASASRSLHGAFGVLDRFGNELSDQLAATPGTEGVRSEALQSTLDYYRYFLEECDDNAHFAASAAQTRVHAAAVAERLGQTDEALTLYEESAASLEKLVANAPEDRRAAAWLARCLSNHGLLLGQQGEVAAGRERLDRAVGLRRGLCEESPSDLRALSDLAAVLSDRAGLPGREPADARGDLDEAIALLARARRVEPNEPSHTRRLAVAHNALSSLLRGVDPAVASEAGDRAIELLRRIAEAQPEADTYRDDLAIAYSNRGALAAEAGRWDAAAQAYGEAAAELQRLALRAPLVPRRRSELAVALASRGFALARANLPDESDRAFAAAEKTLRGLIASYPQTDRYRRSLAALLNNRGVALRDSQRLGEAAVAFAKSVRLEEERLQEAGESSGTLLAVHYANHAQVLGRLGRFEEAARVESKRQALIDRPQAATIEGDQERESL